MKTYLIKVDMKDMWEFADNKREAFEKQEMLSAMFPKNAVGIYKLFASSK